MKTTTEKARKVTALITVNVHASDDDATRIASYREKALRDWIARHEKDIQNEMAYLDEITINVEMGYVHEQEL